MPPFNMFAPLNLLFFLSLLVGNAICLAASSSNNNGSSERGRAGRHQRQSSEQSFPKIACVISTNRDGGQSQAYTFPSSKNGNSSSTPELELLKKKHHKHGFARGVQSSLQSTFLPSGFPAATPRGYLSYAVWQWIQDLSTQLRGVVATQRILEGVGVGKEGATALSALFHYLTRDGCGMLATLLFTRVAASKFRTDVKRWRLFADAMVDVGITLEVAAVQGREALFLPMICLGNMCKAICGVAAGACNGSINVHWAKGSDISDVNAKFGAQQTVTGSLGLIVAALFAKSVSEVPHAKMWGLYAVLTALHLYANHQCMRQIAFDHFNQVRMRMAVNEFLAARQIISEVSGADKDDSDDTQDLLQLPTPRQIAQREPLWFITPFRQRSFRQRTLINIPIDFGVTFDEFAAKSGWKEADVEHALIDEKQDPSYLIATGQNPRTKKLCVVVVLVNQATPLQQTRAYFHALLLKRRLGEAPTTNSMSTQALRSIERQTGEEVEREWMYFWRACRISGWDLRKSELRTKGFEVNIQYRT